MSTFTYRPFSTGLNPKTETLPGSSTKTSSTPQEQDSPPKTKTANPVSTYTLRPYQSDAVESLFKYFEEKDGNPILSLPTGSGKSIIQAAFIQQAIELWPDERFLLLSHVKELLEQNADKVQALLPDVSMGMYSAGLGKRELDCQITVAGIQSVYKRANEMGDISIIIIDECHLVSKTAHTMYRRFIYELKKLCPCVKIIGMSATPYRLDSGPLHKGDMRLFTDVSYDISIKELIEIGYLSNLVSANTKTRANTSKVKKRGGEFITGDLERMMLENDITSKALDEVESFCADRKSWLVFCVGVEHAFHVAKAITERGHSCQVIVGDTSKTQRKDAIEKFKSGKLRALVSVGVLTTGFDAPNADALICLRPTMSPVLWVQMVGRVTRLFPGKENGQVLDFTGNMRTHGPVDKIKIDGDGNVITEPQRECPKCKRMADKGLPCPGCGYNFDERECKKCHCLFEKSLTVCPECGAWVEKVIRESRHNLSAFRGEILSTGAPILESVEGWRFTRHTKKDKPDSMRVWYRMGLVENCEWICVEHLGYASQKAALWWIQRGGSAPTPRSVTEALDRTSELVMPTEAYLKKEGKYQRIILQ